MKQIFLFLLITCNVSFSQDDIHLGPLYGEPRKTSPTSFYSIKKQNVDNYGISTVKVTTREIEKYIIPKNGKVIIHDSSIIPNEVVGEEIAQNLKYLDNYISYEDNGLTYQIKVEYGDSDKLLLDILKKEKDKIYGIIESSIKETGFSPAKIFFEKYNNDYNILVFNSVETTRESLIESFVKSNLIKSDFFGSISEFQNLNGIKASGEIDAITISKVKEYVDFYNSTKIEQDNRLGNFLINSNIDGKTEIIEYDEILKKRLLSDDDILKIEESQKKQIRLANKYTEANVWASYGSRNDKIEKASLFIGDEIAEVDWKNPQSYDELYVYWDKYFEKNPNINSVTLLRDDFQTNKFAIDKIDNKSDISNKTLENKYVVNRTWINITEFARNLKEKYPQKKIILSSNIEYQTRNKISEPSIIKSSDDIGAYMASKSFGLESDQVLSMKQTLDKGKISVFEINEGMEKLPEGAERANVLLISAHKDIAFENYIKELADKGLLVDKTIGLFSCYEKGSANLNSYIISKGAKEVHFFPSKISISATKAVLKEISKITNSILDINKNGVIFDELMSLGVENAIKNPDNFDLVSELRPLNLQIKQISKTKNQLKKNDRG